MSRASHTPKSSYGGQTSEDEVFFEAIAEEAAAETVSETAVETVPDTFSKAVTDAFQQRTPQSHLDAVLRRPQSPARKQHQHTTSMDSNGSDKFESVYFTPRESAFNMNFYINKSPSRDPLYPSANDSNPSFVTADSTDTTRRPDVQTSKYPSNVAAAGEGSKPDDKGRLRDFTVLRQVGEELESIMTDFKPEDWFTNPGSPVLPSSPSSPSSPLLPSLTQERAGKDKDERTGKDKDEHTGKDKDKRATDSTVRTSQQTVVTRDTGIPIDDILSATTVRTTLKPSQLFPSVDEIASAMRKEKEKRNPQAGDVTEADEIRLAASERSSRRPSRDEQLQSKVIKTYPKPPPPMYFGSRPSSIPASKVNSRVSSRRPSLKPSERTHASPPPPVVKMSPCRRVCLLCGVCLIFFLAVLDMSQIGTQIPTIVTEFHSGKDIAWIGVAYTLAGLSFQPVCGMLSGRYGRKPVFLVGIAFFAAGLFLTGPASFSAWFIIARGITGFGTGIILPMIDLVIVESIPTKQRAMCNSIVNATFAVATILGPILGAIFAKTIFKWRILYYLSGGISIMAFVVLLISLKLPKTEPKVPKMKRFDWIGLLLLLSSILLVLIPLGLGGVKVYWVSAPVLTMFGTAVIVALCFVWVQTRRAIEPIFPRTFFRDFGLRAVFGSFFFVGWAQGAISYYVPVFLQYVHELTPVESAVMLLPFVMGIVLSWAISGICVYKFGWYRYLVYVGAVLLTAGGALASTFTISPAIIKEVVTLALLGVGIGMLTMALTIAGRAAAKGREHEPSGVASLCNVFRYGGFAIGVGVSGAIFNNGLLRKDSQSIDEALALVEPNTADQRVLEALTEALRPVFMLSAAMGAFTLLYAVFVRQHNLRESRRTRRQDHSSSEKSSLKSSSAVSLSSMQQASIRHESPYASSSRGVHNLH